MLKSFIKTKLADFEAKTGENTQFMANMLDKAAGAFYRFMLFMPLLQYHKKLPKEAYHVARIVTVQFEDCGECLQTVVSLAAADKVQPQLLQTTLNGNWEALPRPLNFIAEFTHKINLKDPTAEDIRLVLTEMYGEPAMLELACAIACSKVFPTAKRALGVAPTCSQIRVTIPEGARLHAAR